MPESATAQIHAGENSDAAHNARVTPVYLTAGFEFGSFAEAGDRFAGEEPGYVYTRAGNPSTAALERRVAALENATALRAIGVRESARWMGGGGWSPE